MNTLRTVFARSAVLSMAILLASFAAVGVASGEAVAPDALDSQTLEALAAALDDERHAEATYRAIMNEFGEIRPFVNIIRAERRHEGFLLDLYEKYGLPVPENDWADPEIAAQKIEVPTTFVEACRAGLEAEKVNVALYDRFLEFVTEPEIRDVFTYLRDASEQNHLRAFERCASGRGYGRGHGRNR